MFDFSIVTTWFDSFLRQTLGLGDFWSILIECVLVGVAILIGYPEFFLQVFQCPHTVDIREILFKQ